MVQQGWLPRFLRIWESGNGNWKMEDWERKAAANLKHEEDQQQESCAGGQRQKQGKAAPTPPAGWSPLGARRCDTIARRIWNPRVDCRPCAASPVTWLTRCHQRGGTDGGKGGAQLGRVGFNMP